MKENLIPTKDLKTGVKVVSKVTTNLFEAFKPALKRKLGKDTAEFLEFISRRKFILL